MEKPLAGKTVALLVANGFEELEMTEPQRALLAAGAAIKIVSPEQGLVNGWHGRGWGHYFPVDVPIAEALAADFDALIVPGGPRSIEKLTGNAHSKRLTRGFVDGGKPVVLQGHGVTLLTVAERAAGRTVAAAEEIAEAMRTAGCVVSEETVAVDGAMLTTRGEEEDMAIDRETLVQHIVDNLEAAAAAAA
ncbi:DJ-1/PfpI family protein [Fodinicurvata sp. EGI_FJ10296]|uniref:DJ-1/PfpI family protein n=1 Tax=Fodinicurvata sp. EGI_FJ10296 TaxID=3231908 RepID=UPI003453EBE3